MKYILISVNNIISVNINTEIFKTKEDAFNKMKFELSQKLNNKEHMQLLENGIELSNAILNENNAYLYTNLGKSYWHWKIVKV